VALFCVTALHPAGAPVQKKQGQAPIVQVQTELVMVPVIAHRDGKHAGGLKQEDFTMLADGKPQSIAVFEEVHAVTPVKPTQAEEFTNQTAGGNGGATRAANKEIIDNFLQIAATTGGKPCFNRTDLANCLKEAVEDSRDYYLLGFYPDKQTKLGWHSISVKLNGPKADLQYRNGFLATSLDPEKIKLTDLQLAMLSPLDYTSLAIRGHFEGSTDQGGKKVIGFALDLPPEAVILSEDNNRLALDIVVVVRGAAGKEVTRLAQRIDRELTPQQAAVIRAQGIHYTNKLELAAGEYGVWFVVRDSVRGRTGSVVTTVDVK
jgi:hypothetical protein